MEWKEAAVKYETRCRHCTHRLGISAKAYMRKKMTNGKWDIICPGCYKANKEAFDKEAQIEIEASTAHAAPFSPPNHDIMVASGAKSAVANVMDNLMAAIERQNQGSRKTAIDTISSTGPDPTEQINISPWSPEVDEIRFKADLAQHSPEEGLSDGDADEEEGGETPADDPGPKTGPDDGPKYTAAYIENNPEWRI